MTWAKLDDRFCIHRKIVEVGNAGAGLFVRLLTWSCMMKSNGIVTEKVIASFDDDVTLPLTSRLVAAGLLERHADGTYVIHDFAEFNPLTSHDASASVTGTVTKSKGAQRQARYIAKKHAEKHASADSSLTASPSASASVTDAVTDGVTLTGARVPLPDPDPIKRSSALQHARGALAEVPPPEPLGPEATEVLRMLRKQKIIEPVATPKLAETIASRILSNGTKLEWIEQAISDAALEAESNAAVGSPLAPVALARMVAKFCGHARPPKDPPSQPSANSTNAVKPASKPRAHRPFPGTESDVPKAAAS